MKFRAALRQIGCDVTLLAAEDLTRGDLSRFDAIVTGVRAWNTRADLRANYQRLFDYASNGGTVVVQYSASGRRSRRVAAVVAAQAQRRRAAAPGTPTPAAGRGGAGRGGGGRGGAGRGGAPAARSRCGPASGSHAVPSTPWPVEPPDSLEHIGPYPIHISNDRVTVEEAPVTFPNPQLALLHAPNEITSADFDGWVQERGLVFRRPMGPALPERARIARSRRGAHARRHALHANTARAPTFSPPMTGSANCRPAFPAPSACSPTC